MNILEWIFGTISILKIETRGQEFVPWDLSLIGNVFDLASFAQVTPEIILSILGQLILIIALTVIQIYVFKEFCEIPQRHGKVLIIFLTVIILLLSNNPQAININKIIDIHNNECELYTNLVNVL